ncbi:MAG: NERD domain-containing protein [Actinobacteria bacterium]|nr:NERD domain-containing protein [Actinomycetota bacterium]MBU1608530.1 NERD domain-containing protein [Actinomycetota bacterium]MBU2315314.1 NERD domain-containing protein [Actinomycetota bacterium]MBU2384744.1 NERD domain-containing protein [Actinomycetota bacterium]
MRECVAQFDVDQPQSPIARLFGLHPLRDDARAWYRGALGERAVARRLAALGGEWVVIHGIPIGNRGSDIDHLVIGPSGVYTINAKRHIGAKIFAGGGSIRVNGHPTQYVRNAQHEAERVAKKLSAAVSALVQVTPTVVIVDAAEVNYGKKTPVVSVMTPARLPRWLKRGPRTLSPEQVGALSEVAARLSTWGSALPEGMSDAEVAHRFAEIDREVSRSIVRNRLWLAGVVILGLATALAMIGPTLTAILGAVF